MYVALRSAASCMAAWLALALPVPAAAQDAFPATFQVTFADIADMADSAQEVIHVRVRKVVRVANERASGLRPGMGRFYIEADTIGLITGRRQIGAQVRYLVDLPLDARGKPPELKKREVVLFGQAVDGRPDDVRLVSPDAQVLWTPQLDGTLRSLLTAMLSPDAPGRITGVRELLYVPGTLAGQGETQIFLSTRDGSAASITVRHQPGAPTVWGASFSELVADVTRPPAPETLEWYRLACFLPQLPPLSANVSEGYDAKRQAQVDYQMVMRTLGPCERSVR